ncbi:MAG: hypothetical protein GX334_02375 [Firmicutes bacterium]|nr:hypothetical protein [Bacillota bacterium]
MTLASAVTDPGDNLLQSFDCNRSPPEPVTALARPRYIPWEAGNDLPTITDLYILKLCI